MTHPPSSAELKRALDALMQVECAAAQLETEQMSELQRVPAVSRASARNLLHYLAVRQHDMRHLQAQLQDMGLSSLGRMEAHVAASLHAVQGIIQSLLGEPELNHPLGHPLDTDGPQINTGAIEERTSELLGPPQAERRVRVMVTMPSEAASDAGLVEDLVRLGMDAMRINCAHDGPAEWQQMINHLRAAESKLGRRCKVMCDLAGPKLRTGNLSPGPCVTKWKPERDALGCVVTPARIWLTTEQSAAEPGWCRVPVEAGFLAEISPGDTIRLTDTRGRKRALRVASVDSKGALAECDRTGYVTTNLKLVLARGARKRAIGHVGTLPAKPETLRLAEGDQLIVRRGDEVGRAACTDAAGRVIQPASVSCAVDGIFAAVQLGERVLFDDGKFEACVVDKQPDQFSVRITRAGRGRASLGAQKGINFPDTDLGLPALTTKDLLDLDFIAAQADLVAFSFVHRPSDIEQLALELAARNASHLGMILKIETRRAFERLPALLLTGLRFRPLGVMVARGDLGVEIGFERLAEVQEEMLWLCEAAHVPAIWATQVLESLTKQGLPSRSEVTDAAMAGRAECVMLNKGVHIRETVRFLCDVLERMQEHQQKKFPMLRELQVSHLDGAVKQP